MKRLKIHDFQFDKGSALIRDVASRGKWTPSLLAAPVWCCLVTGCTLREVPEAEVPVYLCIVLFSGWLDGQKTIRTVGIQEFWLRILRTLKRCRKMQESLVVLLSCFHFSHLIGQGSENEFLAGGTKLASKCGTWSLPEWHSQSAPA